MPIEKGKIPQHVPKDGPVATLFRLYGTPLVDLADKALHKAGTGEHPVKDFIERQTSPTLADAEAQGKPRDTTTVYDPHVPQQFQGGGLKVEQATPAERKGFLAGASEAVTPAHVAAVASMGSGVPGVIGNTLQGAEAVKNALDSKKSNAERGVAAFDALASLAGAGSSGPKAVQQVRNIVSGASTVKKTATTADDLAAALARFTSDESKFSGKTRHEVAEMLKDEEPALYNYNLKNPISEKFAKPIFGTEGMPTTPASAMERAALNQKRAASDIQAQVDMEKGRTDVSNQLEKDFKRGMAEKRTRIAEDTRTKRQLNTEFKQGMAEKRSKIAADTRTERGLDKEFQRASNARDTADAKTNLNKTREIQRDQQNLADVEKWSAEQAAAKKAADEAAAQQAAIDARKTGENIEEVQTPVRETRSGTGPNGERQSQTTIYREKPPADAEGGGDGGDDGGGGGNSPTPDWIKDANDDNPNWLGVYGTKAQARQIGVDAGGADHTALYKDPRDGSWHVFRKSEKKPFEPVDTPDVPEGTAPPAEAQAKPWVDPMDAVWFDKALADAKAHGYTGSDTEFQHLYHDRLSKARDLVEGDAALAAENDPNELYRQIAKYGGITEPRKGNYEEVNNLWQSSSGYVAGKGKTKSGRDARGRMLATGGFNGVPGVLRNKGGRSLDDIATLLSRQDPRFAKIIDSNALIKAIQDANGATPYEPISLESALQRAGVKEGSPWWEAYTPKEGGPQEVGPEPDLPEEPPLTATGVPATPSPLAPSGGASAEPNLPGVEGPIGGAPRPLTEVPDNFALDGGTVPPANLKEGTLDLEPPTAAPVQPRNPEVDQTPGAIPARLFKSPLAAAGANLEDINAAKKAGEAVPEAGRQIAGSTARQLGNEAVSDLASGAKSPQDFSDLSPKGQNALFKNLQRFMDPKSGGRGQKGEVDPLLLLRMGGGSLGTVLGSQVDPDHPYVGAALGGALGAAAPGSVENLAALKTTAAPYVKSALETANQIHNSALLGPYALAKKGLADIGGLTTYSIMHPSRAGDVLNQLVSAEGRGNMMNGFREGLKGPIEDVPSGLQRYVTDIRNPLSWTGRLMGGFTKATKNALSEAGATPAELGEYTLTSDPTTKVGNAVYSIFRNPLLQHFAPFARIGVNRVERGVEYSPFGPLVSKLGSTEDHEKQVAKAILGSVAGYGAYKATPDEYVRNHPLASSLISAAGGPVGLPILFGMAAKNAVHDIGNSGFGQSMKDWSKSIQAADKEAARDIPGLALIQNLDKTPEGIARNYLSGYTNGLRPFAEMTDPYTKLDTSFPFVHAQDPDTTSRALTEPQLVFNKMLSNVPFVRQTLPRPDGSPSMSLEDALMMREAP